MPILGPPSAPAKDEGLMARVAVLEAKVKLIGWILATIVASIIGYFLKGAG
jgi:hypothetical protein